MEDDVDMKDACFKADPDNDGMIQTLKLRSCDRNSNMVCYLPDNQYVWVEADLQFIRLKNLSRPLTYSDSQFYNKLIVGECKSKADVITTRLLAGRKCLYHYQCVSRHCDEETNVCTG